MKIALIEQPPKQIQPLSKDKSDAKFIFKKCLNDTIDSI